MRLLATLSTLVALGCTTSFDVNSLRPGDIGVDAPADRPGLDASSDLGGPDGDLDGGARDVSADGGDAPDGTIEDAASCGGAGQRCCGAPPICQPGSVCNEGFCAPCPSNAVACGGVCVNPLTSQSHCGACGRACASGESCASGSCVLICPAGLTACGGRCVDLATSIAHCGQCAAPCAPGAVCANGSCVVPCPEGQTVCAGACVQTSSSAAHCGGCGRTCQPARASGRCAAGACVIGACDEGWGNCDGDAANGCETALDSGSNCGRCNNDCVGANAQMTCRGGACEVSTCQPGFGDCDGDAANGCEAPLRRDPRNCGGCGAACPTAPPGMVATCANGACGAVTASCAAGLAECDGDVSVRCETDITTTQNCGRCGNACSLPYANSACRAGACAIASCEASHGDCDANPANGCEADLRADISHCGACGRACAFANASARCEAGVCRLGACSAGFADCDNNPANGCEVDLRVSAAHCGGCGAACSTNNGRSACVDRACVVLACAAGFADCDGVATNLCEADTRQSISNCGRCGVACVLPRATPVCRDGACAVARCEAGFADCNGDPVDGCEVDLRESAQHCGACGRACTVANGTGSCSGGSCRVASCAPGFADCDGMPGNGCEVDIRSAQHCGGCNQACPPGSFCNANQCASLCGPGFSFCSGACYTLGTDPRHCGACGNACPTRANSSPQCVQGICGIACVAGWGDCDGNVANGCEANLQTSRSHCGRCGVACVGAPNAEAVCEGGGCQQRCVAGWGDCDGSAVNGCEHNVSNDPGNCGACLSRCPRPANALPTCSGGVCGRTCNAGWGDCDGAPQNGCEVNLFGTRERCGSCGNACQSGQQCRGGACTRCLSSEQDFTNCSGLVGTFACNIDLDSDPGNCGGCGQRCPQGAQPQLHATFMNGCLSSTCALTCDDGWRDCDFIWQNGCETNITCDSQHCGGCGLSSSDRGTVCATGTVCCNRVCVPVGSATCNRSAPGCR
jgi:Stigma-specific protein, Stig1